MKFPTKKGDITTIHVDQRTTRECYLASLKIIQEPKVMQGVETEKYIMIVMTDLDSRMNDDERIEPKE